MQRSSGCCELQFAMINDTHDPDIRSWIESANEANAEFPIQNLPFGVFRRRGSADRATVGVAIGSEVLDVAACIQAGLVAQSEAALACTEQSLNSLMALHPDRLSEFRLELSVLLREGSRVAEKARSARSRILMSVSDAEMMIPAEIGDYTDFYASIHHATNVGSMFRPDNALLPNYKHVPIGYHGRASSIVTSGTPIRRPSGQTAPPGSSGPSFGPSKLLDYESELGFFVRRGNVLGEPIEIETAASRIFGFCLVNDWSARDIQAWEYQPLGPFLAKNFATTISPWVLTAEAVEPYRIPALARPAGDPQPLEYLRFAGDTERGGISAFLEVYLRTERMRADGLPATRLSRAPFSSMYWTVAQMLAHHASNGCNMRPGDLLASGTVSGESADSRGCMLELTWRGATPLALPNGEERRFLQDGDEVIMKGFLEAEGRATIGFGECSGTILPAVALGPAPG
jgi:fumarylacetoacetase